MKYLRDLPPEQTERLAEVMASYVVRRGNAGKAEAKRRWRHAKRRTVDCVTCGKRVRTAGLTRCMGCRRGW